MPIVGGGVPVELETSAQIGGFAAMPQRPVAQPATGRYHVARAYLHRCVEYLLGRATTCGRVGLCVRVAVCAEAEIRTFESS